MSLEAQIAECLRYAKSHCLPLGDATNVDVNGLFVDAGQSAYVKTMLADRKGGRELLKHVRPGDHIIATAPHRMFRNLLAAEVHMKEWEKHKVSMHFTTLNLRTDTPNGKLLLQILSAAAQWDSAIRSARQKEASAWRKKDKEALAGCDREAAEVYPEVRTKEEIQSKGLAHVCVKVMFPEPSPAKKKVAGVIRAYVRVSRRCQEVEIQKAAIMRWVENNPDVRDTRIVWYSDTGQSGFKKPLKQRPAGRRMLKDLQPGDLVITLRADRIARTIIDMGRIVVGIHDRGAHLCMIDCGMRTDDPQGAMMISIMSFVAQLESENTRLSNAAALRRKYVEGGVPVSVIPNVLTSFETHRHPITYDRLKRKTTCLRFMLPDDLVAEAMRYFIQIVESGECKFRVFLNKDEEVYQPGFRTAAYRTELFIQERTGLPGFKRKCKTKYCPERDKMVFREKNRTVAEAIQMLKESTVEAYKELQEEALEYLSQFDPERTYVGLIGSGWATRGDFPRRIYNRLMLWTSTCEKMYREGDLVIPDSQDDLKMLLKIAGI